MHNIYFLLVQLGDFGALGGFFKRFVQLANFGEHIGKWIRLPRSWSVSSVIKVWNWQQEQNATVIDWLAFRNQFGHLDQSPDIANFDDGTDCDLAKIFACFVDSRSVVKANDVVFVSLGPGRAHAGATVAPLNPLGTLGKS